MTKLDYEPKRPRRLRFSSRGFTYLLVALFLAFVFVAGELAVIPHHRYDTGNLVTGAVLILLAAVFGYQGIKRWLRDLR